MSELQAALLAIGIGVMLVVYLYGWWQQRRLSHKFGAAFKASHVDALYQESPGRPASSLDEVHHVIIDEQDPKLDDEDDYAERDVGVVTTTLLDESCSLLNERSDYIIDLQLREPANGAVLGSFWQRKFDFGKPLQVCGLTLQSQRWERVIADGPTLYVSLRIALQLVDRGGVISATKLADFRDLVLVAAKQIQAEVEVPDIQACHARAVELDALCAEVDRMVGINLIPSGDRMLLASRIAQAAALQDLRLESDGAFHLLNAQGLSLFSLINQDTKPFQHHTLATATSAGITLLLDVPRVEDPARQFDLMTRVAQKLEQELQLNMVDDHRVVLSPSGLDLIRAQIAEVEAQMCDNDIVPGSAQARRLFS
ncbi:MAG: cell division protein ZipA C-terminal FtsZ-binding domain-containing protein [Gallionella sp.]|nr:cell division protein ZipA C-terminal FtsZ-binding domain-containing protein [Gallionella sp.]